MSQGPKLRYILILKPVTSTKDSFTITELRVLGPLTLTACFYHSPGDSKGQLGLKNTELD